MALVREKKQTKLNIDFLFIISFLFDENRTLIEFAARSLCIEFTVAPFCVPYILAMAGRWIDVMSYTTFVRSMTTSSCLSRPHFFPSHWWPGQPVVLIITFSCRPITTQFPLDIFLWFHSPTTRPVACFDPVGHFFFLSFLFLFTSRVLVMMYMFLVS